MDQQNPERTNEYRILDHRFVRTVQISSIIKNVVMLLTFGWVTNSMDSFDTDNSCDKAIKFWTVAVMVYYISSTCYNIFILLIHREYTRSNSQQLFQTYLTRKYRFNSAVSRCLIMGCVVCFMLAFFILSSAETCLQENYLILYSYILSFIIIELTLLIGKICGRCCFMILAFILYSCCGLCNGLNMDVPDGMKQEDFDKYFELHVVDPEAHHEDIIECPICFESTAEFYKSKKCQHIYHKDCILPWVTKNASCPLCRADIMDIGEEV